MTSLHVLAVVEDEPDVLLLIRSTLMFDPRILFDGEAATAEDAIRIARESKPGLIILDHSINGPMTGLQVAPLLKEVSPGSKVLLFTAFSIEEEAKSEPAIDRFLSKSKMRDLLPTVQEMLGLSKT